MTKDLTEIGDAVDKLLDENPRGIPVSRIQREFEISPFVTDRLIREKSYTKTKRKMKILRSVSIVKKGG